MVTIIITHNTETVHNIEVITTAKEAETRTIIEIITTEVTIHALKEQELPCHIAGRYILSTERKGKVLHSLGSEAIVFSKRRKNKKTPHT
jgi:hypothetical protein